MSSEQTACPACAGTGFTDVPYPGAGIPSLHFDGIRLCTSCGLGHAIPVPDQRALDEFYGSGSFWQGTGSGAGQRAHENVQAMLRVRHCLPRLPQRPLHVLDVGAGHGYVADWIGNLLPGKVTAYSFIEPDPQHRAEIRTRRRDFEVHALDALPGKGSFDFILLNHVLEHVAEPANFMENLVRLLAPGGVAYIETPHLDFRFKSDVFPHTLFFTPGAFEQLAHRLPAKTLLIESFGAWPGREGGTRLVALRLLSMAFAVSVRMKWQRLQARIDQAIWRYRANADGIWLRWLLVKRQQS